MTATSPPTHPRASEPETTEGPGSVLVVDDDPMVAEVLCASLSRAGFEVHRARNMDEALSAFREGAIDVVLTDLLMPGGSGLDLLRHIELRDPMVPVVIITGDDSVEAAAEAVRERAFDYLTKPVRREQIVATARKAMAARLEGRERREAQEKLRRDHRRLDILNKRRSTLLSVLFNRADEGIIIWDEAGILVDASESFVALVREPLSTLLNRPIDHVFEPHPSEGSVQGRIRDLIAQAGPSGQWRGDVTLLTAGGRRLPSKLSLSVCVMPGRDRNERYVVGLLHYERSHLELSRQLQQADRLATIGLLAGSAAHEIKNDLNPLLAYLSLLEKEDEGGMVSLMRQSVRRIQDHVEQILAPLRPRIRARGAVVVQRSLEDILELLRRAGRLRRLELTVDVTDDVVVHADKDELHQILVNLITNALDALGDGDGAHRGAIEINVVVDGPYGLIEVRDDGIGIPDSLRTRVFEPFFTTKPQGGTGLGLPVVHDIVRSLRGRLSLESEEGHGTTVRVRLPLFSGAESPEESGIMRRPVDSA